MSQGKSYGGDCPSDVGHLYPLYARAGIGSCQAGVSARTAPRSPLPAALRREVDPSQPPLTAGLFPAALSHMNAYSTRKSPLYSTRTPDSTAFSSKTHKER